MTLPNFLIIGAIKHPHGEASPQYLHSPTAPARIAADMPGVKLIASLRNPADRAYSSYLGRLRGGWERRSVEEAMRPGTYYVESSLYHAALSRYLLAGARCAPLPVGALASSTSSSASTTPSSPTSPSNTTAASCRETWR